MRHRRSHPSIEVLLDRVEIVRARPIGDGSRARILDVPESPSFAFRDVVTVDDDSPLLDPRRGTVLLPARSVERASGWWTSRVLALASPGRARDAWIAALAREGLVGRATMPRGPFTRFLVAAPPELGARGVASALESAGWETTTGWLAGRVLAGAGRHEAAIAHLEREEALGESPIHARIDRSRCLAALGRTADAIEALEREASRWAAPPAMVLEALAFARAHESDAA
jgi:hypothetical protein